MAYAQYDSQDYDDALLRQRCSSRAMDEAIAKIQALAKQSVVPLIKYAARRYMLAPSLLDNLCAGLSYLSPVAMVNATKVLFKHELEYRPRRWFGLGGEIPTINRKAACIYARLLRAQDHKRNRKAA